MDGILTVGEVVESRADGLRPGRHRPARLGLARLRRVEAGEPALSGLGTLTRLDTSVAAAPAYLGPLGGMGLTAYAGLIDAAELRDGRRRVGLGRRRRRRQPRRPDRQAARAPGDRQRGLARQGPPPARRPRPRRRLQLPRRPGRRAAARGGAGRHRRLLRQRRRRAPRGRARCLRRWGRVALCGAAVGVRERRSRRGARATCSRRPPTTSRCAASAAAATCTAWTRCARAGGWLAEGACATAQTVFDGLEHAPEALVRMLAGETIGKTLVRIAADAAAQ